MSRFRIIDLTGWLLVAVFLLVSIDAQAACGPIPSDYVGYGASGLSTDRNVRVNSNRLSGSGNALQPDGVRTTPSPAPVMPDLDPASFPGFSGGGDITVSGGDTGATGAGTYGEIKVEEDATFSFADSGGTYYIDKLTIEKNVQITFSPGIYYIDTAKFDQDVELQVSPSGEVKLFINSEIEVGKKASINQSGGVDEFQVYGYSGAKALLKQGADFRGLLYFPSSSSEIKLEKNVDYNGVVVTAGDVIVGKNVDFTLSVDDQTAIGNVSTCPTPTTMPDPVGYWQMDETTWGTVADSSGNGFDGTAQNGAATDDTGPAIPGPIGTCRYGTFDGSNDYVSISALPNLTNSFTIAAWIRADELGNDQRIFADDRNNTGGFAFSLGDGGAGKLRFFSRHVSPVVLDSAAVISQGNWHFVAVVHDVGAKTRKIYVDGVTTPVVQDVYTGAWGTDNGDASIGGEVDGTSEGNSRWRFNGNIDEVRVYQNALSGSQVATLMGLTHPCSTGVPDDASGFNCMVSGGDDITGRLYTQLAGQPFVFDVSALKDSDGDGTSDSRETDFATKGDRTLLVELVDGTGGASCATYPALTPAVNQNLVFTAADAGRKSTSVLTVNSAYRELRCRVTDATPATPVVG
ncbi:MAG: LamG domain-containing protein, partial [Gammaproteobacteria bacterium]|nr:LamG domain-containing protein [Gammaproteobacteria bacterium]